MAETTVKEMLFDAVKWDESFLAHAIYYAVQQKLIELEASADKIPFETLDFTAVGKMRDENVLSMCRIKLFTVPMGLGLFAFYLAENENEARAVHKEVYGKWAEKIIDISNKMDEVTHCEKTNRTESFRELKRRVIQFPYFAGEMQKKTKGRTA